MRNTPNGLAIELLHGRTSPAQELNGWGSEGPVFFVAWVHVTYMSVLRIGLTDDDEGELSFVEDLMFYDGVYYGDWSVIRATEITKQSGLASRVCEFDPAKAVPPPLPLPAPAERKHR